LLFPLWGSGELEGYARDTLGDLVGRDKRGTLRRTLLAYLEAGGSQVDAAARLGVHRNTLAYRLKQIAELTGTDPTKPQSHLALHMALLASVLPAAPGR
jgi:DNA-binding PucR family transcriptional regulator